MSHVLTVLEGRVAPERIQDLQVAYAEAGRSVLPHGLIRSCLLRHRRDPDVWRLETLWESPEALAALRDIPGEPRGVRIFEAAGVQPELSVFAVIEAFEGVSTRT